LSATHDTIAFSRALHHSGPPVTVGCRASLKEKILRWHDDLDRGAEGSSGAPKDPVRRFSLRLR